MFNHKIASTVLYYENVRLRHVRLTDLFRRSKLWAWFVHSGWERSDRRDGLLWHAIALLLIYRHGTENREHLIHISYTCIYTSCYLIIHVLYMLYITGGTVLAWDSLSVSPVSVPSLGLCNTDHLAPNVVREAIKVENRKMNGEFHSSGQDLVSISSLYEIY